MLTNNIKNIAQNFNYKNCGGDNGYYIIQGDEVDSKGNTIYDYVDDELLPHYISTFSKGKRIAIIAAFPFSDESEVADALAYCNV